MYNISFSAFTTFSLTSFTKNFKAFFLPLIFSPWINLPSLSKNKVGLIFKSPPIAAVAPEIRPPLFKWFKSSINIECITFLLFSSSHLTIYSASSPLSLISHALVTSNPWPTETLNESTK